MSDIKHIDFTKLLGFETVTDQISEEGVDFQAETIGAKLGAKVGDVPNDQVLATDS